MIGESFGRYKILDNPGGGNLYQAEDVRLRRRLALRVLPGDVPEPQERRRFERQSYALAVLNHPNIVTLYGVEEIDGQAILTLEWIEGRPLTELLPAEGLPAADLLRLSAALTDAVRAAHEHGIVHRDLAPHNLMVTQDGELKVLGFGTAALLSRRRGLGSTPFLDLHAVAEAVAYRAPECLAGELPDQRSEVFSLGAVVYEMACGKPPFQGDSPAAVLEASRRLAPPPLDHHRGDLPKAFTQILQRCLADDPEERPTASQLAEVTAREHDQLITSDVVTQAGGDVRAARWTTTAFLLGLGLATLALGAWWAAGWLGVRAGAAGAAPDPASSRLVVLPLRHLGQAGDPSFAAGLSLELSRHLTRLGGFLVVDPQSTEHQLAAGSALPELKAALDVDYVLDGTVRWQDGPPPRVRVATRLVRTADEEVLWSEDHDAVVEDIFALQSQIGEQVAAHFGLVLSPATGRERAALAPADGKAFRAYLRGRDFGARPMHSRENGVATIRNLEQAVQLDPDFSLAWAELGIAHARFFHYGHDRTRQRLALAREAVERARELAPRAPETAFASAVHHYYQQAYDEALRELAVVERALPGAWWVAEMQATVERRRGHFEAARAHFRKGLKLDPHNGRLLMESGVTDLFDRDYAAAQASLERALVLTPAPWSMVELLVYVHWLGPGGLPAARAILESAGLSDDPGVLWFWFWQEIFEGKTTAALARLEEANVETVSSIFTYSPIALLRAQAHDLAGQRDEARAAYHEAAARLQNDLAAAPEDARRSASLGVALAGLGQDTAALAAARRAVELAPLDRDALLGPSQSIELARTLTLLARFDEACEVLAVVLAKPAPLSVALLERDPSWRPLRAAACFTTLASRAAAGGIEAP